MDGKIEYKGYTIEIMQDEDARNPRHAFGGMGHLLIFHRNYDFGDNKPMRFKTLAELRDWLIDNEKTVIYLPIYIYDHSGITIATKPFSIGAFAHTWDSGQIGYIYMPYEEIRSEYKWKLITKKRIAKILTYLEQEVKQLDDYLHGHVYGYNIVDPNGKDIDSCWGFYGNWEEDSYMLDQAKEMVDYDIADQEAIEEWYFNNFAL